jgi:hypothetical protein
MVVYLGSSIFASWTRIMSVVLPAVFSRVFRTVELQFTLYKMILICTAPGLYLGIGIHSSFIGGGGGQGRGSF